MEKETHDARAGRLLRRTRYRAVLTQAEVASLAGVPQSTVSAYESGGRQPSLPVLSKLLEAMGSELTLDAVPLPDRLTGMTGPLGLRVRRHRHLIRAAADRLGFDHVHVHGPVAQGAESPVDDVELLIDRSRGATLWSRLDLATEIEQILGFRAKILVPSEVTPDAREQAVAL